MTADTIEQIISEAIREDPAASFEVEHSSCCDIEERVIRNVTKILSRQITVCIHLRFYLCRPPSVIYNALATFPGGNVSCSRFVPKSGDRRRK
jgi:hypothetical protein